MCAKSKLDIVKLLFEEVNYIRTLKIFKNIFAALIALGFLLVLGTAGTSDLEAELHKTLMSDKQFYTQIGISLFTITAGTFGFIWCKNKFVGKEKSGGKSYSSANSNKKAVGDSSYARASQSHKVSTYRSAG